MTEEKEQRKPGRRLDSIAGAAKRRPQNDSNPDQDQPGAEKGRREFSIQIRRQFAENAIRMMMRAGIPKELIGWDVHKFTRYCKANLGDIYNKTPDTDVGGLCSMIYDLKSDWSRNKLAVLVDGGTPQTRLGLSQLVLGRVVLGNFFEAGRIGVTLPFSMLKVKFNSFDDDRQTLITNLLSVPALYVSEVVEGGGFRADRRLYRYGGR